MSIAFVYSGQGSQRAGMGADLYDAFPIYRQAFDAMDSTGELLRLSREGSMEEISDTRNTQPLMVAVELAITSLLTQEGIVPDMVAGLSLGEYAALSAAGVFSPTQAVELVTFRGNVMSEAVRGRECGMVAVLGLDAEKVCMACRQASAEGIGVAEPANFNCPGQIVISGDAKAVERASELAKEMGAKSCKALPVSGPFHTSLMKSAGEALAQRFKSESFGKMRVPVVFNTTAKTLAEGTSIADMLERQVQSSVHFGESVETMIAAGVDHIIEIGCGSTLCKFIRRVNRDTPTHSVDSVSSLEKTLAALKEA